jgi:hypothetical protein
MYIIYRRTQKWPNVFVWRKLCADSWTCSEARPAPVPMLRAIWQQRGKSPPRASSVSLAMLSKISRITLSEPPIPVYYVIARRSIGQQIGRFHWRVRLNCQLWQVTRLGSAKELTVVSKADRRTISRATGNRADRSAIARSSLQWKTWTLELQVLEDGETRCRTDISRGVKTGAPSDHLISRS